MIGVKGIITFNRFQSYEIRKKVIFESINLYLNLNYRNRSPHVSDVTHIQKEFAQIMVGLLLMMFCTVSTIIGIGQFCLSRG
jgi:hypothetical protein